MKYAILLRCVFLVLLILIFPDECKSQRRWHPYLNTGYVTNFKKCPDCIKSDTGGSIRFGVLNKGLFGEGRFGFYAGYLWFNEHHEDYLGYDDKGWVLMAGFDFLVVRIEDLQCYAKLGIANEKFITTYRDNTTETERSFIPDFGLLFSYKYFNTYVGWQPSEPYHFNIGVGFTLYKARNISDPDF